MPVRAAPLFEATLNATDPSPLPDAPLVIVIHDAFDAAVHAQPVPASTCTVFEPPPAGID